MDDYDDNAGVANRDNEGGNNDGNDDGDHQHDRHRY